MQGGQERRCSEIGGQSGSERLHCPQSEGGRAPLHTAFLLPTSERLPLLTVAGFHEFNSGIKFNPGINLRICVRSWLSLSPEKCMSQELQMHSLKLCPLGGIPPVLQGHSAVPVMAGREKHRRPSQAGQAPPIPDVQPYTPAVLLGGQERSVSRGELRPQAHSASCGWLVSLFQGPVVSQELFPKTKQLSARKG